MKHKKKKIVITMMFNRVNIYDDDCQQYHHQHNKKLKDK